MVLADWPIVGGPQAGKILQIPISRNTKLSDSIERKMGT